MARVLPMRANLRFLKTRAKSILKLHTSGSFEACETLRELRRFAGVSNEQILSSAVTLLDVQYALSLYYGFESWNHLRHHIVRNEVPMEQNKIVALGDVRIDKLGHFYAMSFYAFDKSPEAKAMAKLRAWAGPKGLLDKSEENPIYGFDNPSPHGNALYGYEFWIRVDNRFQPEGDMRLIESLGGSYAIATCPDINQIGTFWGALVQWSEKNGHRMGTHQCLEKHIGENANGPVLDLYLPII